MTQAAANVPRWASFYDFYDGPEHRPKQLALYRALAGEAGQSILELACGTGIIAIDLALAGHRVIGLDISPEMLQVTRQKLAGQDELVRSRIRLVEGDMKDFDLCEQFDGVFLASNSFGYLTTMAEQQSCLAAMHKHLRPAGLVVIEERNHTPEGLTALWQNRLAVRAQTAKVNPGTGRYTTFNWVTTHLDFVGQTVHSRSFIDEVQADGTVRRYIRGDGTSRQHYFNRFELQLLIEQAGFTIRDLCGGHDGQSLGPQSHNMIFVAVKR